MAVNKRLLADEFTFRNGEIYALPIQYLLAKLTSISSHSEKTMNWKVVVSSHGVSSCAMYHFDPF